MNLNSIPFIIIIMPSKKFKHCSNYHNKVWNDEEMGFIEPNPILHRAYIKITKNGKTKWIGVGWYCTECGNFSK